MEDLVREFKGIWIPSEVWLDDRLNALDKIILLEIDSLDSTDEGCYASNKYLSEFCQCTETKISTAINKLVKLGYLEVVKFDGRKRYLKSRLSKIKRQTLKNLKADFKNFKGINIINNIDNKYNIYNKPTSNKKIYFENKELNDLFLEFLEVRKKKKAINSDRAIKMLLNKLGKYNDDTKYKMIEKSILNSWKDVYELKEKETPIWFDQNNKVEEISENEQEELENILKEMESEK